jgi:hypothetical protein
MKKSIVKTIKWLLISVGGVCTILVIATIISLHNQNARIASEENAASVARSSDGNSTDNSSTSTDTSSSSSTDTTTTDTTSTASTEQVTLANFNKIHNGMTLSDVEAILGSGTLVTEAGEGTSYHIQMYSWQPADGFGASCNVTFTNGKADAKAQMGLQ